MIIFKFIHLIILFYVYLNRIFSLINLLHLYSFKDKNELEAAKQYLEEAAKSNLPEFLKALSDVLVNVGNSAVARTAAGLQLKNHLTSKDTTINQQYQQRWLLFAEDIREYIKKNVTFLNFFLQNMK